MGLQDERAALRAFFFFHLRVGIRIARRKVAAIVTSVFALFFILRYDFFGAIVAGLLQSHHLVAGFVFAPSVIGVALMASPRVCLGLAGWMRHLPASSLMHRRLACLAIFIAIFPVLLFLAFLAFLVDRIHGIPLVPFFVGLPILGLSSAQCVLPVKHRYLSISLAGAACVFAASNHWALLFCSFVLLMVTDRISGPLTPVRKQVKFRKAFSGFLLSIVIAWRALRFRIFFPYLASLSVLGLTRLFVLNNDFSSSLNFRAVSFGGLLSLFLYCAIIAGRLSERRPCWPWARSLPWSARERVLGDALILAVLSLPLLVLLAFIDIRALWPTAANLPPFAVLASLFMRRGYRYRLGAMEMISFAGAAVATTVCLLPWISFAFLAFTPFVLNYAAAEERNQKVSRWHEMQHLAAGDSLSWSKS
jgi:hypothetical protein